MGYTLIIGFRVNILLLLSVLYIGIIGRYKMLILGVLPIPIFFGKIRGRILILYSMIFGVIGWLE